MDKSVHEKSTKSVHDKSPFDNINEKSLILKKSVHEMSGQKYTLLILYPSLKLDNLYNPQYSQE